MHTEFSMHYATSIVVERKAREGYTVTYVTVTDKDGNSHILKAFHDEPLLEQSILAEVADEY